MDKHLRIGNATDRKFLFAGRALQFRVSGFMNGAAETGRRVSEMVLETAFKNEKVVS